MNGKKQFSLGAFFMEHREVALILVLILLIVQMYLCLELRRNRLGRGLRAAMLADLLATAFLLFSFLYHDTAVKDIVDEGRWPAPVPEPPEIPLAFWLVVLFALGSAAFAAAAAVRLRRFVNEHPTASAVKESIKPPQVLQSSFSKPYSPKVNSTRKGTPPAASFS